MTAVDERFREVELAASTKVFGERFENPLECAVTAPLLKASVARLVRRIAIGQILPRRAGPQDPQHAVKHVTWIAKRPTTTPLFANLFGRQERLEHGPLLIGQVHIHGRSENDPLVDPRSTSDRISTTSTVRDLWDGF